MRIISHREVDYDKWYSLVSSHPYGSVFHTPFAIKLFEGLKGHVPFGLFIADSNEEIVAMLTGDVQTVKQGSFSSLSRRLVSYASPLFQTSDFGEELILFGRYLDKYKGVYSEIRNNYFAPSEVDSYDKAGYVHEDHLNIIIDLTKDKESLWKEVHSKRRNEIRKALKEGLIFQPFSTDRVPEAYTILQEVYTRAKLPLFPLEFFTNGFLNSDEIASMKGFGAFYEGKMVGSMIALCFNGIIYDLFAGSLSQYYSKNPNDLIPWEVFMWGKENGYRVFDFGGAGKPNIPYGVRDYKLKFGGSLVNYGRYQCVHSPVRMAIATRGFKLLQVLKKRLGK